MVSSDGKHPNLMHVPVHIPEHLEEFFKGGTSQIHRFFSENKKEIYG